MIRFIAMVLGIVGGVVTSQAPEFTQQYIQNLKGGVDRLEEVVQRFDEDAARSDMSRDQALNVCIRDEISTGQMSCRGRADDVAAYERYQRQLVKLQSTEDWQRPIALLRDHDRGVAESVMEEYRPAVPTTIAGAGYALAGFTMVWAVASLLLGLISAPFRRY